jgi:predicted GIY-YIG superfamily endonuclease
METRFQTIQHQVNNQQATQARLEQRLLTVESQTSGISENISALMQHLRIPTSTKRRKDNLLHNDNQEMEDVEHAHHSASSALGLGDTDF